MAHRCPLPYASSIGAGALKKKKKSAENNLKIKSALNSVRVANSYGSSGAPGVTYAYLILLYIVYLYISTFLQISSSLSHLPHYLRLPPHLYLL
jgi:hypothetical protein